LIQDKLKKGIAEDILFGKLANGGKVIVSAAEDDIVIEAQARETPQKSSNQKSSNQKSSNQKSSNQKSSNQKGSKKSANGSLAKS